MSGESCIARSLRDELEPLPQRMTGLPIDERGYVVPWFVAWVNKKAEFRAIDGENFLHAIGRRVLIPRRRYANRVRTAVVLSLHRELRRQLLPVTRRRRYELKDHFPRVLGLAQAPGPMRRTPRWPPTAITPFFGQGGRLQGRREYQTAEDQHQMGTLAGFVNPQIPGPPDCSNPTSVTNCIAETVVNFRPVAAAGHGYRPQLLTNGCDP